MKRLPAGLAPVLIPLILTFFMTGAVSAIATYRAVGLGPGFLSVWPLSWLISWAVAFPVMLLLLPVVRRLVGRITEQR